mmetsp:Transcript_125509/g.313557  ORF Transcript_125509/g.313557 Transcript_125509/m.313557 type:complete len:160 (-) Transcript_125509:257-736(-)
MGQTACASAPKCNIDSIAEAAELPVKNCSSLENGVEGPLDACLDIQECGCGEEPPEPSGPLTEFTYAVDSGVLTLGNASDDQWGLSHRSSASDVERQEEFLKKKLEVAQRTKGGVMRGGASNPIVFPAMPRDESGKCKEAQRSEHLRSEYKNLGITVVR